MPRVVACALGLVLLSAAFGRGQDMPLFTFAKLGEKWVPATGATPGKVVPATAIFGDKTTAEVVTQDRATIYVGYANRAAVWAYPIKNGEPELKAGAPYAPLRVTQAYDNSREARERTTAKPPTLPVAALLLDPAGRLYAATAEEIQVFDPTGRACGSLPLPGSGIVEHLQWEAGNEPKLIVWIAGQKWTRAMK